MRIITRGEAMRIHQQHPASVFFRSVPVSIAGTVALRRIPVAKYWIFPAFLPCLQNAVRTVLARMSG